jgi:endonuclease/exonuclease/phosphatase family metal-dependent hydrolase
MHAPAAHALRCLVGDDPAHPPIGGASSDEPLVLVDTLRALHPNGGLPDTFNGFRDEPPTRRIDYVFATPDLAVVAASVDLTRDRGRWPSDHCPVRATLALPD